MSKIIAIDPGYDRLGLAILEKNINNKDIDLVYSTCLKTDSKTDFPERIWQLGLKINEIITEFKPKNIAVETLYFSNNKKTALKVAETRGMIIYLAKFNNLSIFEYHPNSIKSSVTGNGKATKAEIQKMIPFLIKNFSTKGIIDDEIDAISIGIAHLVSEKPDLKYKL